MMNISYLGLGYDRNEKYTNLYKEESISYITDALNIEYFTKQLSRIADFNDYLVIDLMNEIASDFQQKEQVNAKNLHKRSEEWFKEWVNYCRAFVQQLKKHFKPSQIILHEAYFPEKNKLARNLLDGQNITLINKLLKKCYDFFKSSYSDINVISIDNVNITSEKERTTVNKLSMYDSVYYRQFMSKLKNVHNLDVNKYDVSIIITTFNNEEDLDECIYSALNQTISKVELIIVDDGSTDATQEVVLNYVKQYDNIKYAFLDNACNPSRNRNIGISMSEGKYLSFLDGDDYLALDACEKMIDYGEKENADIIVGRMMSFTSNGRFETGIHNSYFKDRTAFIKSIEESLSSNIKNNSLLYKFKSAAAKLYKRSLIFNTYFDESIYYAEDFLFSQKTFLKSQKTIFIEDFVYYYRGKVESEVESLTQKKALSKIEQACFAVDKVNTYFDDYTKQIKNPETYFKRIKKYRLQELLQKLNDFDTFLYETTSEDLLSVLKKMKKSYMKDVKQEDIEIFQVYNYVCLNLLMNEKYESLLSFRKILLDLTRYDQFLNGVKWKLKNQSLMLTFKDEKSHTMVDVSHYLAGAQHATHLTNINFTDGKLKIEGVSYFNNINVTTSKDIKHRLILKHRNSKKEYVISCKQQFDNKFNSALYKYSAGGYSVEVDFNKINLLGRYDAFLETRCYGVIKRSRLKGFTRKFNLNCTNKYFKSQENNYEVIISRKGGFLAFRLNELSSSKYNLKKLKRNLGQKKRTIREILRNKALTIRKKAKLALITLTQEASSFFTKKDIWLIGEKVGDTANDNGYAFFKYCREHYPDRHIYYIIDKKAKDYHKVKKLGNTIQFYSLKHLYYSMNAKYVISTDNVNIMLPSNIKPLRKAERIFIQHGVISFKRVEHVYHSKKDIADKFLVSSNFEQNIIENHYGYNKSQIVHTGMPRTQYLSNDDGKKSILLSFTWRPHIRTKEVFLQSQYYRKLNSLLQNEKLNAQLKDSNIEVNILLHPRMVEYMDLLHPSSSNIRFSKFSEIDVKECIEKSSMLITDYSSILFDFAYLQKPVIMYGFDYFKGNYTLEKHQVEKVLPNTFFEEEEDIVDNVCEYIKNNFTLAKKNKKSYRQMIRQEQASCNHLFKLLDEHKGRSTASYKDVKHEEKKVAVNS
ncbi:CDP-glycerol glycerophosphotransferase family protein [Priestia aryabhattai]|uniref:CDP-glycerol glycerophosphotransferase family protein n=1 Tax=Priestia aryabhattai TaxID=412384 RepID=UPI00366D96F3